MAKCLDYIAWRGDLPCSLRPVNEVDRLLFSVIGKPDYTGIIPADEQTIRLDAAVEQYLGAHVNQTRLGLLGSPLLMAVLRSMAETERYKSIRLSAFVNKVLTEEEEQFSALTVHAPDGICYISFRGTDDTLVGWKENCGFALYESVPAQRDALAYLEQAAERCCGPLIVCGHSKGGNLAVYAACNASQAVQDRIVAVYSYDGPGFMDPFLETAGYLRMKNRIVTYVPQRSIVGMLMNTAGTQKVVCCEESGAAAHDVFQWNVDRAGMIPGGVVTAFSNRFHHAINETLELMTVEQRKELFDATFDILYSTGANTLSDFTEGTLKKSLELAKKFRKTPELRAFLLSLSGITLKDAVAHVKLEHPSEETQ